MTTSVAQRPYRAYNVVTNSATATFGPPTSTGIRFVRVACTTDCYVAFDGSSAVAGTSMLLRTPTTGEVFRVDPGVTFSALAVSAAGLVNFTELAS